MDKIVKNESLHLQAYNIIKEGILKGDYEPSKRVIEAKLADRMGISRGPVREAIRMLIQDGLLIYNNGFVRVYEPTMRDVVEIFQCRENLETLSISLAIKNITDNQKDQIADNLEETNKAFEQNDGVELGRLDQQFHDIIMQSSNNNQLIQLLGAIRTKIHYMRNSMVNGDFYPSFVEEHNRIYELILKGEEETAEKIMKEHIRKGLEGVLMHINH
ncbi:GntR family transcriptional regulator [Lentibacillus halophilus]|uniref:GntR family transcriptional regulator n=1 Tax=Lentibacillus halophilus TaxID=295065 RepID=A0ABP3J3J0_9BACI